MFGIDLDESSIGVPKVRRSIGQLEAKELAVNRSLGWRSPNQMKTVKTGRYFLAYENGATARHCQ